jgi:HD-GYP domain-containing protein (c-di-GMP phosphodiesterase class II)
MREGATAPGRLRMTPKEPRMLRVPLEQIRPGMRLALAVHHPYRPTSQLLASGCVLQDKVVRRLMELRVGEVWIDSPQLRDLRRYVSPERVRAREQLSLTTCHLFEQILARQPLRALPALFSVLRELRTIFENDRAAAVFLPCLSQGSDLLVQHATDTAVLALQLAMRLEGHITQQRRDAGLSSEHFAEQIAAGALLHDVGLYMVDGGPMHPEVRWHDEEPCEANETHALLGYRAVKPHLDGNAAAIVMHHHQHYDGSGFPERDNGALGSTGLVGTRIPIYVRVVTLADVFDETRIGQGDRPLPTSLALAKTLSDERLPWFDPQVAEVLPSLALPFPPGSWVTLTDGSRGVIVDIDPAAPDRPVVQLLTPAALADPHLACPTCDLRHRPEMQVRAIDGVLLPQPPLARAS